MGEWAEQIAQEAEELFGAAHGALVDACERGDLTEMWGTWSRTLSSCFQEVASKSGQSTLGQAVHSGSNEVQEVDLQRSWQSVVVDRQGSEVQLACNEASRW
eukprot:11595867-Alexandrium_andersonii.AAC.1